MKAIDEGRARRKEILDAFEKKKGDTSNFLRRTFLQYDRYSEAQSLLDKLEGELGPDFNVVDYGCGVGDYGFAFGRQGCPVVFFDFDLQIEFVNHRLSYEDPPIQNVTISRGPFGTDTDELIPPIGGCQLAIFGEVLEHLNDPAGVLKNFYLAKTKYIFTSSYPYRNDEAADDYWKHGDHKESARLQQPACRELLETKYEKIANFGGQWNLWRIRS